MKPARNDRARIEIHGLAALERADADLVESRSEYDGVRRRGIVLHRIREHMQVVVVAVELHRIAARAMDVERDHAPLPVEGDIARERTDLHRLEILCRRHRNRRLAAKGEAHHAAQLRLLDLPLMAGPPPVERHRRAAHLGDRRLLAIDFHRIARIEVLPLRHGIDLRRRKRKRKAGKEEHHLQIFHAAHFIKF